MLMLLMSSSLAAQDSLSVKNDPVIIYNYGEMSFMRGYFDKAEQQLLSCVKQLKGMHRTSAYRLLALCALEKGNQNQARYYVSMLLKSDPYYSTTLGDPQRLIDLVNESKALSAGITTASRMAESIEEAPVPVTLITEEMIRYSGATTLQEVLRLYVPGMIVVEGTESNIAFHGIYGVSQDKILILQDGHKLNGTSTNAEPLDYRNSLDKIQQIEVLRGPSSSLYGNAALTAVVNIITRKGAVLKGGHVNGTVGTQKTYGASLVVGGGNNVVDVLGWGSVNSTDGFPHVEDNLLGGTTTLYSGAYNRRPSYDFGIKARWGDFSMTVSSQRSKKTPYINIFQISGLQRVEYEGVEYQWSYITPEDYNAYRNYDVSKYSNVSNNGPGTTRTNHHLNLDYSHSFEYLDFTASGFVSMERTSLYNVLGDSVEFNVGKEIMLGMNGSNLYEDYPEQLQDIIYKMYVQTKNVFQVIDWENISFGGSGQVSTKYNILGNGTAVFGAQFEHFSLTDGTLFLGGENNNEQMVSSNKVFNLGKEYTISGYAQIKHYFSTRLILNSGIRFDHKKRLVTNSLNHFSPRLSLIYKLNDALSTRVSFNHSFVDAPYIYRASNMPFFGGGSDMKPESMNSYQVGLSFYKPGNHIHAEISAFYNTLDNLIVQNVNMTYGHLFQNAAIVRQTGIDASVNYSVRRFFFNANATWQRVLSSENYSVYEGNRFGIPQLMGNLVTAYAPYIGKGSGIFRGGKLWLNLTVSSQSKTYYQDVDVLSSYYYRYLSVSQQHSVNANVIIGAGVTYEWKYLDINFSVKNITNNQYMLGSTQSAGVPNTGRQFLAKMTFKF